MIKKQEKEERVLRMLDMADSLINLAVRLAMIPVLLCGIYIVADTMGVYADAGTAAIKSWKPEEVTEETLREISGNCIAWLEMEGTSIDYPVMQGADNIEYLNKNPYGDYSLGGSIFMDYRNSPEFDDEYTIIYGHHMSAGLMFGALDSYSDESFFRKHLTGKITAGNDEYTLHVYAFMKCDASSSEVFNTSHPMDERLAFFRKHSWHTSGSLEGEKVVALTTCKAPGATDRYVLLCWLEKTAKRAEEETEK